MLYQLLVSLLGGNTLIEATQGRKEGVALAQSIIEGKAWFQEREAAATLCAQPLHCVHSRYTVCTAATLYPQSLHCIHGHYTASTAALHCIYSHYTESTVTTLHPQPLHCIHGRYTASTATTLHP